MLAPSPSAPALDSDDHPIGEDRMAPVGKPLARGACPVDVASAKVASMRGSPEPRMHGPTEEGTVSLSPWH
jgi:hypothetical protein